MYLFIFESYIKLNIYIEYLYISPLFFLFLILPFKFLYVEHTSQYVNKNITLISIIPYRYYIIMYRLFKKSKIL